MKDIHMALYCDLAKNSVLLRHNPVNEKAFGDEL